MRAAARLAASRVPSACGNGAVSQRSVSSSTQGFSGCLRTAPISNAGISHTSTQSYRQCLRRGSSRPVAGRVGMAHRLHPRFQHLFPYRLRDAIRYGGHLRRTDSAQTAAGPRIRVRRAPAPPGPTRRVRPRRRACLARSVRVCGATGHHPAHPRGGGCGDSGARRCWWNTARPRLRCGGDRGPPRPDGGAGAIRAPSADGAPSGAALPGPRRGGGGMSAGAGSVRPPGPR
jgi:hypothetical protein